MRVCVCVCVCGCVCVGGISEDDRMRNTQGFCENCQIALERQGFNKKDVDFPGKIRKKSSGIFAVEFAKAVAQICR